MTMPSQDDIQRQAAQGQQMTDAFRQVTGGVPAIVYIREDPDGFRVVVRTADGSPIQAGALVDTLINAMGMCCQQLGMTVKV